MDISALAGIGQLAEALAQYEIIRSAQAGLDQLAADAAAAEADETRDAWSGTQKAQQVASIREQIVRVKSAVLRLEELLPGDPAIKAGRQCMRALRALRTELAADPEE